MSEVKDVIQGLTYSQIKEHNPVLLKQISDGIMEEAKVEELKKNSELVKRERDELLQTKQKLETDKVELEKRNVELQAKLDVYENDKKSKEWQAKVNGLIEESKIDQKLLTDTFKKQLHACEKEEDVKVLLEDRIKLTLKSTEFDNSKNVTNPNEQKKELSDDEIIKNIKGN